MSRGGAVQLTRFARSLFWARTCGDDGGHGAGVAAAASGGDSAMAGWRAGPRALLAHSAMFSGVRRAAATFVSPHYRLDERSIEGYLGRKGLDFKACAACVCGGGGRRSCGNALSCCSQPGRNLL